MRITLLPSATPIKTVRVKWFFDTLFMQKVLADTWGVARADLQWRSLPFPHPAQWYFAAFDGEHIHGFGVKTGCNSFCSWEIEPDGVTLLCDTRNGGEGVVLTEPLLCAEAVYYKSEDGPIDWAGYFDRLAESGYSGTLNLELSCLHSNAYAALPYADFVSLAYQRLQKWRVQYETYLKRN